jgi:hypothetical protein
MNEKVTYGHRHLGCFFKPIISIGVDGFEYKDRFYKWADIKKIKRYDSAFWSLLFYQAGTPLAYLYLKDGTKIKIRGRVLEKEGMKSSVSSSRGTTNTYDQLMELIAGRTAQQAVQQVAGDSTGKR